MEKQYRIFLENLSFTSFSKLMEAVGCRSESVSRNSRSNANTRSSQTLVARLASKKRSIIDALTTMGDGPSSSKKPTFVKMKPKDTPVCLFPYDAKKAVTLLYQRVKDEVIHFSHTNRFPSVNGPEGCEIIASMIEEREPSRAVVTFKRLFNEKLKAGKILL